MLVDTTTKGFVCQSLLVSTHSLSGTSDSPGVRHFSSLASSHTHIRASTLSLSCALAHSLFHWRGVLGHALRDQRCSDGWLGSASSQGAHDWIPVTDSPQPGVEPASTSCILVRAWAYRWTICLMCSSSSRCRMRRKFFSSGMEKACHWRKRKAKMNENVKQTAWNHSLE